MMDSAALCVLLFTLIAGSLAASKCDRQIDLGFVLDGSASMGEENFQSIKPFVKNVISKFVISDNNTRVGVIPFSHYYKMAIPLNQFTSAKELEEAIDKLAYEGSGSSLSAALKVAQSELFIKENGGRLDTSSRGVLQVVIVVSDGGSSTGIDSLLSSSSTLKDAGKRVFVVGLGKNECKENLRMMASEPLVNHFFNVQKSEELKGIVKALTKAICSDLKPVMRQFKVTEGDKTIASFEYQEM